MPSRSRSRSLALLVLVLTLVASLWAQDPKPVTGVQVAAPLSTATSNLCAATTCWFVRPNGGAYGTENGTSWANAFDGFSDIAWASLNPGHIVWVAGGTYTQDLVTGKSGTSGNPIQFRRARSDDTGIVAVSGWSSGFDAEVLMTGATLEFVSFNYLTISGATTAAGGTQGWRVAISGTAGTAVSWPNGSTGSNIRVEWVYLDGPGSVFVTNDLRGIDGTPFTAANTITFSHIKLDGFCDCVILVGITQVTIEYSELSGCDSTNATFHPNLVYMDAGGGNNFTFRYNYVHGLIAEGLFWTNEVQDIGPASIYGNVFANTTINSASKVIQPDNTGTITNLKIWNNTFDDVQSLYAGDGTPASGNEARNNIISRSGSSPWPGAFTTSHQLVTSTAGVFVDRAAANYHLVSTTGAGFARNAGTDLSGSFTTDKDGVTFGGDGTWDIGAYEYVASAPAPDPVAWWLWRSPGWPRFSNRLR